MISMNAVNVVYIDWLRGVVGYYLSLNEGQMQLSNVWIADGAVETCSIL